MLRLENISWSTPDGVGVLNNLDLTVPDGKLIVITGPNGGGKTTLAKIIAGIYRQDGGKIFLNDRDITEADITERAKMGISFAFQQPVRFKGITVRRLIELAAGEKLPLDKICNYMSRVGLCAEEYINREVNSTLSGGEIKRIEIATVLARHSVLTVFDEPEAGIDLWSFTNLIKTFEDIRKNLDGSIIIISHQERILRIADEIAIVADGSIKAQGKPDEMMKLLLENNSVTGKCFKQEEMF
ncbi:MAG: ATP-binding cassette domain-containing protein [Clostridia bacterium]|nr:ATP-binding cassette domain-containing protein [Clostridia bacterium]